MAAAHTAVRIAGRRIRASVRVVRERRRQNEGWGATYGSLGGCGCSGGAVPKNLSSNFSSMGGLRRVLRVEERVVRVAVCVGDS
jgi:hypothetical protein